MTDQKQIDMVLYKTTDPSALLDGRALPALTVLLHRMCQNDPDRFEEALRIVGLFIAEALATKDGAPARRVRHKKRGTEYDVMARGELQMAEDLVDGAELFAYRGDDGRWWFRRVEEFEDGRFEDVL